MGLNNLQTGGTGGITPGGLRNLTEISAIPASATLRWPIDEGSGTTVNDSIGTNNGTLNNTYTWNSDTDFVGDFYIDLGVDGYIVADSVPSEITAASDWSVGFTITQQDSISNDGVVWVSGDSNGAFILEYNTGDFHAIRFDGSSYTLNRTHAEPAAPYTARAYLTYDSSTDTLTFYLNDAAGAAGSDTLGSVFGASNFVFGRTNDTTRSDFDVSVGVDSPIVQNEIGDSTEDYNRQPWS